MLRKLWSRVAASGGTGSCAELERTARHWAQHDSDFTKNLHWTELPQVQKRIRKKITGSESEDLFGYTIRKFFREQKRPLETALSLGCGSGATETGLTQYVTLRRHDAIDISGPLINIAKSNAEHFPQIRYFVGDLNRCDFPSGDGYDLVIAHQSLHHVSNLRGLLAKVQAAMRPEGIFIFDEYVGPRRFQWSARQMEAINASLRLLPDWLILDVETGEHRRNFTRPSAESVAEVDPTEAVLSDQIIPVAQDIFTIIEQRPYGGALLHMLLHRIAGNFRAAEAQPWLEVLF